MTRRALPFVLAGALFVVMALATSVRQRLPLHLAAGLAIGYAVGPAGLGLLDLDPCARPPWSGSPRWR